MAELKLIRSPVQALPVVSEMPRFLHETGPGRERFNPQRGVAALLREKEILLQEVQHRVANSLQIIASILSLDARKVQSDEAQLHLNNARRRILAVATVQQQFDASRRDGEVEIAAYLRQLCRNLSASMIDDSAPIRIDVRADTGAVASMVAMNLGLIVTEFVINALKHAFRAGDVHGAIVVTYQAGRYGWRLTVSDNGVGMPEGSQDTPTHLGQGSDIVAALVRQLDGCLETSRGPNGVGTSVSVFNSTEQERLLWTKC